MSQVNTNELKTRRKAAGITQKQLAAAADISYSTLTKLEQGAIASPSITLLNDVAAALGCRAEELLEAEPLEIAANPGIEFVYFDVGGVLVQSIDVSLHRFAETIHASDHAVKASFHEHGEAGARGNITLEELKLLMMLRLGVSMSNEERQSALAHQWIDDMEPITAGHRLLGEVVKHHKVGLLTNVFPGFFPDFFQRGLLPDISYKAVVKSCDVGFVKPEPAMYEVATQAARTKPAKILLIDNSRINVKAARDYGWQAELFDERAPERSVATIVRKHFKPGGAADES